MAKAATVEAKAKSAEYEFVAEFQRDAEGNPLKERPLFVDNLEGKRVLVKSGTRFVAEMVEEIAIDRRGVAPREVPTGQFAVAVSDVDIAPGCLTSCIRTGRAVLVK